MLQELDELLMIYVIEETFYICVDIQFTRRVAMISPRALSASWQERPDENRTCVTKVHFVDPFQDHDRAR